MEAINTHFRLTKQEKVILELVAMGLTSKEIAQKLNLTDDTIETHRRNMIKKAGVKNMIAVIMLANRNAQLVAA